MGEAAGPTAAANPCLACGACCACYRASFYWAETDDAPGGRVPAGLTEKMDDFRVAMRGTEGGSRPRCVCLTGQIGAGVACAIYELRASVCREFEAAWQFGRPNERCDRARAAWGLAPLGPADWQAPRPSPAV